MRKQKVMQHLPVARNLKEQLGKANVLNVRRRTAVVHVESHTSMLWNLARRDQYGLVALKGIASIGCMQDLWASS